MRRSKSKGQLAAKWVNQRQAAAIKGFAAGSVFDPAGYQNANDESCEGDNNSPRSVPYNRDRSRTPIILRLADNSNSLRRMQSFEEEGENKEGNQQCTRKKTAGRET